MTDKLKHHAAALGVALPLMALGFIAGSYGCGGATARQEQLAVLTAVAHCAGEVQPHRTAAGNALAVLQCVARAKPETADVCGDASVLP